MMKRILLLTLVCLIAPASAVEVSRSKVDHPAIGTAGGSALHAQIEQIYETPGDNANSRYNEFSAIADSTTVEVDHNFGANLDQLNVLIYTGSGTSLTRVVDPETQSPPWTIQEKTGSETTIVEIITPSSGGPHTFAVVTIHGKGAEKLNDLSDVDLTSPTPEDGQALVYTDAGTWIPGASGDASFKIKGVTDPNATIKGGGIDVAPGRQIATYDGAGSQAVDFRTDLTCDLDALLGSSPVDDTTYIVYVDMVSVGDTPTTTTDTGEELYPVECSDIVILTAFPDDPSILGSRYVHIGNIHSADTGTVWSGTGSSFNTFFFRNHSRPIVNTSPVVYNLGEQAIGSVGSSNQIVAGHVLQTDSFGFTPSDDLAFWNASGVATDSSGQTSCGGGASACDLSAINGAAFAVGISGDASTSFLLDGVDDRYEQTDAYYDTGDTPVSYGGWFYADWSATGNETLMMLGDAGNRAFRLFVSSSLGLACDGSTDGTNLTSMTEFAHGITTTSWQHIICTYDSTADNWTLYFNGEEQGTLSLTQANTATNTISIGDFAASTVQPFDGRADEIIFTRNTLTAQEIRKLYSYRIDHNQNVPTAEQNWVASFEGGLANQLDNGWIVDKSANSIWFDFLDLSSTDLVSLKLKNESATSHVIPLKTFDTGLLSSAPSFPLSHGLGAIPTAVAVIHEGQTTAGDFDSVKDKCSWDATQITCTGLNTVDGTHRLRLVLSQANVAAAIKEATATDSGIVTTGSQTFAGDKTFNNTVTVNEKLDIDGGVADEFLEITKGGDTILKVLEAGANVGIIETYDAGVLKNRFVSDAGESYILEGNFGLGIAAPEANVHVFKGDSGGGVISNSSLFLEHSTTTGITIATPDANEGYIHFSSPAGDFQGEFGYNHADDRFQFFTNGNASRRLSIDSAGTAKLIVDDSGDCNSLVPGGNVCAGEFIPTISSNVNCVGGAGITHLRSWFNRVGDTVEVTSLINCDADAITTFTSFIIDEASLPFAPNLTGGITGDCVGIGTHEDSATAGLYTPVTVIPDAGGCKVQWISPNTANAAMYLKYSYRIP